MNENVKIFICTHTDFDCPVHNPVYEVIDARTINGDRADNGLHGSFYSELLTYKYLADHPERLPEYVGFCGYRKYFEFMDDVPDIPKLIREHSCIVTERQRFDCTVYEQYARYHARQDMDLFRNVARRTFLTFGIILDKMLLDYEMHTCNMFIVRRERFVNMMRMVWQVLDAYLAAAGDITERINSHPDWYLRRPGRGGTFAHQYRIGGYLGERLISAYIMDLFPDAKTYKMIVTEKPKQQNSL